MKKKQRHQLHDHYKEHILSYKDIKSLEIKGWEKIYHESTN